MSKIKKILCVISLLFFRQVFALNSAQLIQETLTALPNCLHYQIKGTCFWLTNTGQTITTLYVSHYVPDVVVSVYAKVGDNTWQEDNAIIDIPANTAASALIKARSGDHAGSGQQILINNSEQNIYFFESDVIGNPGLVLFRNPLFLPSIAKPMLPYYVSLLDNLLWRGFLPESLPEQTYAISNNLMNHVGVGLINWGGVFPHEGKVVSTNSQKAASVIVMRAVDLLTNSVNFGHIKKTLSLNCGTQCHANPFLANNQKTLFQMVYPVENNSCSVLGNDLSAGDKNFVNENQKNYVWIVWRQYQGCLPGHGVFLYKVVS